MSSVTVASRWARRRTIRSRFTSARVLWMRRIARRSSGWSTTDAMVERMRAGEGLRGRLRLRPSRRSGRRINGGLYQYALMRRHVSRVGRRRRSHGPLDLPDDEVGVRPELRTEIVPSLDLHLAEVDRSRPCQNGPVLLGQAPEHPVRGGVLGPDLAGRDR